MRRHEKNKASRNKFKLVQYSNHTYILVQYRNPTNTAKLGPKTASITPNIITGTMKLLISKMILGVNEVSKSKIFNNKEISHYILFTIPVTSNAESKNYSHYKPKC